MQSSSSGSPNVGVEPANRNRENRYGVQIHVDLGAKQKAAKRRSLFEHPFAASYQAFTASCHDSQSLSVIFKHLREAGRILAQRLNRVKKKAQVLWCFGLEKTLWDLYYLCPGPSQTFTGPLRLPAPGPLPLNDEAPTARRWSGLSE